MKRALVLSGGGNKGAFEAGVIYHLITQQHIEFDLFAGTSVGALNAAFLAQGGNWDEQSANIEILKNKWLTISGNRDIYRFKFSNIIKLLFGGALYQPVGLKKLIKSIILPEQLKKGKPLLIPTVALEDGLLYVADSRRPEDRDRMTDFILASASIPVYFPPVEIRQKHWVDGGLRDMTPLNAVMNENPTEIFVVTTYPVTSRLEPVFPKFFRVNNIFSVIHRIIDILTSEIAINDIRDTKKLTGLCQGAMRRGRLVLITPKEPFEDHGLDFSPKILSQYFEKGIKTAQSLQF